MLLIDTKANDNSQFYGTAIGKATMSISGPQENMHMSILALNRLTALIFLFQPTTTRESGEADFIVFKTIWN